MRVEQSKRTKQVIEENRLKRVAEYLREYNSPEAIERRAKITSWIDDWIERHAKKVPTLEQVEAVISQNFCDYPKVLDAYMKGDKKVIGWMIGKVRNVLPGVEHTQVISILRQL